MLQDVQIIEKLKLVMCRLERSWH